MRDTTSELNALLEHLEYRQAASSIGLVAFGGSIAYGLDTKNSDIDLRGFFLPTVKDLLLMKDLDTIDVNDKVDGTMYSARKIFSLLLSSNPNVVEIFGLLPQHILISSPAYELMCANKDIFLSRHAVNTFGGYAVQQLRRIENSMSRDKGDTDTAGALRSMTAAIKHFETQYAGYADGDISVALEDDKAGASTLFIDMDMRHVPVRQLRAMCGDLDAIAKNADNLAARNRKKETDKLSKHMSHLIRLLRMGSELLETGKVNTYRTEDAELLLKIKQGLWLSEDENGVRHVDDAFWDLLDAEQARFEYAEKSTSLPDEPDTARADEMLREFHRQVVLYS